jgi:uncharacterized repeat protein (TIGR01451 family)
MKKDFLARLFSVISGFSLLANSIVYPFAIAYAQSAEPTSTPDAQVIIEPTDSPTAEPTSTPDATVTPTVTPTPVEETLTPTPVPTETPVIESTVSESNQAMAPPTEEPAQTAQESATPESTPSVEENGEISATVLPNTQASSINEIDLLFETESSAAIVTDKGDYAPTDTVLITGTGFIAGKTYDLLITGSWNFSFSDKVTADENGNLFYSYQLDRVARPEYLVEIKSGDRVVSFVNFTDALVWPPSWTDYLTSGGDIVNDFEDGVYGKNDDSNGGTNVSPEDIDIASGALKSGTNPGTYSSLQYFYSNSGTVGVCLDDLVFLRMRLVGDPRANAGGSYYGSAHWDFLIDANKDGSSDYVVDLNGGKTNGTIAGGDKGTLGLYPNNSGSTTYTPSSVLWLERADGTTNNFSQAIVETYGDAIPTNDQYFIQVAIPLAANPGFSTAICEPANLNGKLFASTSDSGTDPLQKDWMGADAFFVKDELHKSVENITNPGAITLLNPAKPGDVLRYSLSVKNTGTLLIPGYIISDDISDILEYSTITSFDPDNNGKDGSLAGGTISWLPQDIAVGSTITEKFEVTVKASSLWPVTGGNLIMTNTFGEKVDVYLPLTGNIIVHKDVQGPNGQAVADTSATFKVKLDGANEQPIIDGGTVTYPNVNSGTHTISESVIPDGYSLYSYSPDTDAVIGNGAQVTVPAGQTLDVYIINRQNPTTLTVVKTVDYKYGGTKTANDFVLKVDSSQVTNGQTVTVVPGAHTVSEDPVTGYIGTIGGDCAANGSVSLSLGENKTCSIVNTDVQPKLTVTKIVTNDNGGDLDVIDFPLFVKTDSVISGQKYGFNAGTYTVSETGDSGYSSLIEGDCAEDGSITLAVGDDKTCTITNDDIAPKLTVIKYVDNSNGGTATTSDFSLTVGGNPVTSGVEYEYDANTPYVINEVGTAGYSFDSIVGSDKCPTSLGGTITLAPGDDITCTITNEDIAPSITLIKRVIKDNGGTAGVNDFGLSIGAIPVSSGQKLTLDSNTPYIIDEAGLAGYEFSSITGDSKCPLVLGDTITLDPGEDVVCTIVNDDIAPTLTLVKEVVLDNGGDALASEWTLQAADPNNLPDSFYGYGIAGPNPVKAGVEYIIGEAGGPLGYSSSAWVCDGGTVRATTDRTFISIPLDTDVTCTITNDDVSPSLTVIKNVINDDDGTLSAGDFTMDVTGTNVSDPSFPGDETGTTITLDAGSYSVSETGGSGDYTQLTPSVDCSGTIAAGENKICTITNDDNDFLPAISVDKSANVTSVDEPGGNVTFTFTVTNQSTVDPVTITSLNDSVYGTLAGDADCQVGTVIPVSNSCSFEITRFVGGDASDTDHANTFTAHVEDNEGNDTSASDDATVGLDDVLPLVDLNKEVSPSSMAEPGGDFTFTLTITNNSVEDVTITALTDDNALSTECLELIGDTLAAGASPSCSYIINHSEAGTYDNTASVTIEDNESNSASDTDSESVTVRDVLPEVAIDKSVDTSSLAEPGGDFTFTLTITNNSVEDVVITALTDDNTLSAECLGLIGDTLTTGSSTSCTYTVNHTDAGSYENTAEVTVEDNEDNTDSDNDTETVRVSDELPSVSLDKSVDVSTMTEPGGDFTFTLTITNNSVEPINITDLTDDNILSTECLNLIGASILPGNNVSCTYVINHSVIGTYDNTAEVTAYDNEENRTTARDDESVTITQENKPELTLTKTNDKPNVSEGDTINYTLKVKNTGNIKLGNFEIIDVLPGGFEYIANSSLVDGFSQEPTVNGGILTWIVTDGIAVDQEVVVTYQVKVGTNLDPGIYTNLASCRTVVREEVTDGDGPFLAAGLLIVFDQIDNDIDCECNGGDPVYSSSSIGGVLAYSGALTPQVLGASTELPATGSSTWYLLLITMVALSGIGLKVAGRKLKNEIN